MNNTTIQVNNRNTNLIAAIDIAASAPYVCPGVVRAEAFRPVLVAARRRGFCATKTSAILATQGVKLAVADIRLWNRANLKI